MSRYRLGLLGGFSLVDPAGKSLTPKNRKECALLAMLALSPKFRRSRSWLQSRLWGEMSPARSAANLRQALFNLRRIGGTNSAIVDSNRTDVWLLSDRIQVEPLASIQAADRPRHGEILEGLDIAEESFEDWISDVRRNYARTGSFGLQPAPESGPVLPVISFGNALTDSDAQVGHVANHLIDCLIDAARTHTAATVRDQRASSNPVEPYTRTRSLSDCEITVRLRCDAEHYVGFIMVVRSVDRRILWSTAINLSARPGARHAAVYAWLTQLFVDYLIRSGEVAGSMQSSDDESSIAIGLAMSGLFSPGKFDMSTVRMHLDNVIGHRPVGLHHVLRAMTLLYQYGDRSAQGDVAQQITSDLDQAFRLDPANPVIYALSGQIAGFYNRSLDLALDRTATAIRLAPDNPVCMLMRATSVLYAGEPSQSYSLALRARQSGRGTFVEPIIETTCCMAAALSGQLDRAIVHGELAAQSSPGFRPPLLHLMGSYLHLKRDEEAIRVLGRIRSRDPDFSRELLASPDYPLGSEESRQFLLSAMSRLGPS